MASGSGWNSLLLLQRNCGRNNFLELFKSHQLVPVHFSRQSLQIVLWVDLNLKTVNGIAAVDVVSAVSRNTCYRDSDEVFTVQVLGIPRTWLTVYDTGADDSFNHGNPFLDSFEGNYALFSRRIDIQYIIRDVSARVVDLLGNVQAFFSKGFCDMRQSSRYVTIHYCESNRMIDGRAEICSGKVDTVLDCARLQVLSHGFCGHTSLSGYHKEGALEIEDDDGKPTSLHALTAASSASSVEAPK